MEITPKICSVDGCERPHYGLGYCNPHWQQYKNLGYVKPIRAFRAGRLCAFDGCDRAVAGPEYCQTHQKAFNRGEELKPIRNKATYLPDETCLIDWCQGRPHAGGFCKAHGALLKFGLTPERANELFSEPNPKCSICGERPTAARAIHIDHDHSHCKNGCNECVRGLLCRSCNQGIGFLKDNIEIMQNAIFYLEEFNNGGN